MCNGEGVPLGGLGRVFYLRCRQCGWDYSDNHGDEYFDEEETEES